jgi:signal transduction histidine kinase
MLVVSDNGLGIDMKKHADKLFGFRKTFHKNKDSKGLGLFITRNQVEAMGGNIVAESTPGIGTRFIITF